MYMKKAKARSKIHIAQKSLSIDGSNHSEDSTLKITRREWWNHQYWFVIKARHGSHENIRSQNMKNNFLNSCFTKIEISFSHIMKILLYDPLHLAVVCQKKMDIPLRDQTLMNLNHTRDTHSILCHRSIRRHSQAFSNRTGLMSLGNAPTQLKVLDFLSNYKKPQPPVNLRLAKTPQTTDTWRQKPIHLSRPSRVDVSSYCNKFTFCMWFLKMFLLLEW